MARIRAPLQSEFPYHVCGRCINRDWFSLDLDVAWVTMTNYLYLITKTHGVRIHAFVLMNNHFHLIISTPHGILDKAMALFMRETSRALVELSNRINGTYGQRHFRSVLSSLHYYLHAYKYVYRNPVEAGLCQRVEEYPYSTLSGLLGRTPLLIPVVEDTTLFSDVEGTLHWLNQRPQPESWSAVRNALRRPQFRLALDRATKKEHNLEFNAL